MHDNNILNLLEFSTDIDKKTYIFPTSFEGKEYGASFSQKYRMMYIEQIRGTSRKNLKVKIPGTKNLMYTILSEEQLR